jgi:hypothetical protein
MPYSDVVHWCLDHRRTEMAKINVISALLCRKWPWNALLETQHNDEAIVNLHHEFLRAQENIPCYFYITKWQWSCGILQRRPGIPSRDDRGYPTPDGSEFRMSTCARKWIKIDRKIITAGLFFVSVCADGSRADHHSWVIIVMSASSKLCTT